jgi:hypothetical protein
MPPYNAYREPESDRTKNLSEVLDSLVVGELEWLLKSSLPYPAIKMFARNSNFTCPVIGGSRSKWSGPPFI